MADEPTITRGEVEAMVECVAPSWRVADATRATDGHHVVYLLDAATPNGREQCVLKATPPGKSPTCDGEARLLAVLGERTSLPVPTVLGAVDDHDDLPAPFVLVSALRGANHSRTALADYSAEHVDRLARSTGRLLADLHALDVVDAYGAVDVAIEERLDGERPSVSVDQLRVREPAESWTDYLASEVERVLAGLESTRFDDVPGLARPALHSRIAGLSGPFEPVLARIDQSLDNATVDPATGAVLGLLDWEFVVASTPAYDLAFVEHSLSGGHWKLLPDVPDRSRRVREGLLAGYADRAGDRVVEQFGENRECYALLAAVHAMCNFENWFDQLARDVSWERRDRAAALLRERVRGLAERA